MPASRNKFKSRSGRATCALLLLIAASAIFAACSRVEGSRVESKPAVDIGKIGSDEPETVKAVTTITPKPSDYESRPVILAFGDSLTAGYGLAASQSYPSLLQRRLDEKGYHYRVVNAGISGDTTAGGLRRVAAALKQNEVKLMVLELGANDMLRGQSLKESKQNLAKIIEQAQRHGITVVLAGMEAPTNFGFDYEREMHDLYQDLAKSYRVKLIPFFLAGVGGIAELNQHDGVHPNVKGTEIVMENVWRVIEPLLQK